jgi:hypothetical protein
VHDDIPSDWYVQVFQMLAFADPEVFESVI